MEDGTPLTSPLARSIASHEAYYDNFSVPNISLSPPCLLVDPARRSLTPDLPALGKIISYFPFREDASDFTSKLISSKPRL